MEDKLRFGLQSIPVFRIVDQLYCEKKGHLTLEHPEVNIISKVIEEGVESHKILEEEIEPILEEEIEEKIKSGEKFILSERSFVAEFEGITIGGKPDLIIFNGNKVDLLIDFKFSFKQRIYPPHHAQCQTNAYILNENGFDTTNLFYALVFFNEEVDLGEERLFLESKDSEGILSPIVEELLKAKNLPLKGKKHIGPIEIDECKSFIYPFDMKEAKRVLTWAIKYWLDMREPMPAKTKNKCRKCGFNALGFCNSPSALPLETIIINKEKIEEKMHYNVIIPK